MSTPTKIQTHTHTHIHTHTHTYTSQCFQCTLPAFLDPGVSGTLRVSTLNPTVPDTPRLSVVHNRSREAVSRGYFRNLSLQTMEGVGTAGQHAAKPARVEHNAPQGGGKTHTASIITTLRRSFHLNVPQQARPRGPLRREGAGHAGLLVAVRATCIYMYITHVYCRGEREERAQRVHVISNIAVVRPEL